MPANTSGEREYSNQRQLQLTCGTKMLPTKSASKWAMDRPHSHGYGGQASWRADYIKKERGTNASARRSALRHAGVIRASEPSWV